MADTAVHIKSGGGQEILIAKGLNLLMSMLFFSFLHSSRGTYFHSHNFSITVSFVRSHCSHIFKSASGAHGLLIASNAF